MIRNFINIIGITPEDELHYNNNDQIIILSDSQTLFIPDNNPKVNSIYEVTIDMTVKSTRTINYSLGKLCVIDGVKKFRFIYTNNNNDKANIIELSSPFNTFIELSKNNTIHDIKIHVLDAYLDLLSDNKIYSNIIYSIDVNYNYETIALDVNSTTSYEIQLDQNDKNLEDSKNNDKNKDNLLYDIDSEYL